MIGIISAIITVIIVGLILKAITKGGENDR